MARSGKQHQRAVTFPSLWRFRHKVRKAKENSLANLVQNAEETKSSHREEQGRSEGGI